MPERPPPDVRSPHPSPEGDLSAPKPGLREPSVSLARRLWRVAPAPMRKMARRLLGKSIVSPARLRFATGVRPLSSRWGERGKIIHRYYLEQFLQEFSSDIQGRCLEFQEDSYTSRFGGGKVGEIDIIHRDPGRSNSTIVADLTTDNDVPSDSFDCIICTYVLHAVFEKERMVSDLYRILKPGGVLLVCVPDITVCYPQHQELWRFSVGGMDSLLSKSFGPDNVEARNYGNSLVAAGEIRGLATNDFTQSELDYHDSRYGLLVCARAVKPVDKSMLASPEV